jgi:hypothetical protein
MQNKFLGKPQECPKCGQYNISGLELPRECRWCDTIKRVNRDLMLCGSGFRVGVGIADSGYRYLWE